MISVPDLLLLQVLDIDILDDPQKFLFQDLVHVGVE